jgi:hypothetical protein
MSDWRATARSSVKRLQSGIIQAAVLSPGASVFARAVFFTIVLVLLAIAALIIIPVVFFAGLVFLLVFAALKVRQLVARAAGVLLPRDDGRRNVRVRLPAEPERAAP